jgi:hypothetical protein
MLLLQIDEDLIRQQQSAYYANYASSSSSSPRVCPSGFSHRNVYTNLTQCLPETNHAIHAGNSDDTIDDDNNNNNTDITSTPNGNSNCS